MVRLWGRGDRWGWLGLLLSLACLVWLGYTTDWAGVGMALAHLDVRLLAAATALNLASIPARTARWRLMLRGHGGSAFGQLTAALLIGQSVNVLAPAPLGDLARAALSGTGEVAYALGTLVVETVLDLCMLVALALGLLSLAAWPIGWQGAVQAFLAASGLALAVVATVAIARRGVARRLEGLAARWTRPWLQRLAAAFVQLLSSLGILGRPAQVAPVLAWSVLIWALYVAVNYALLGAVGQRPSLITAGFLLAVLQVGVAVPSSPGRIGVYHLLCVQALRAWGVQEATALAYALVLHLISVLLPMALGVALAWRWRHGGGWITC